MDPQRMTVDRGLMHHAVTPLWEDKSKAWLAQWFSDNGYARAYGSNPANWSGLINPFTGGRSYSQTHAVGQRVTSATPDATDAERVAGYRVFYIVANPTQVITWHAGDWTMNRRSIAIENLGDYRNYPLRDGDMRVIADFWRPLDQRVGGAMQILLHNEVYATACPARIAEARNQIVEYINNPPKPPVPQTPTWSGMDTPRAMITKAGATLVNVITGAVVKAYAAGERINDLAQKTVWNGKTYVRTSYSATTNVNNGFDINFLEEIPVVTTEEKTVQVVIPFESSSVDDPTIPKGETRIIQAGVDGLRISVYTITLTNGVETSRVLKSQSVTEPVNEVIGVGTMVNNPLEPGDGEDAKSWLQRVFEWILEILSKFTYKK